MICWKCPNINNWNGLENEHKEMHMFGKLCLIWSMFSWNASFNFDPSNFKYHQDSCGLCHWPKCYHVLNWFFLPKPGFLEFIWIFNGENHLKIQYLSYSESKSYQINSIKILLIKIFPTTPKAHSNSSKNFSYNFNLIFSEKFIQYSRTCTTSPNVIEPSPCTPPHWELSKDTKNTIWSIMVWWIS
jgi:hypothetical protein